MKGSARFWAWSFCLFSGSPPITQLGQLPCAYGRKSSAGAPADAVSVATTAAAGAQETVQFSRFDRYVSKPPIWGCIAPREVVALSATTLHKSVGKGVQEMQLLQIEHRISVEQVAHTAMEKNV